MPRLAIPGEAAKIRSQQRRGIQFHPRSVRRKIKISRAVVIRRGPLQCVTDAGRQREKQNNGRRARNQITESQMNVDTYEHEMIGKAVDNSALPALTVSQARELAIGIVERVGENKQ